VELEQLDAAGAEWSCDGPGGAAVGSLGVCVDGFWLEGAPDADGGAGDDWMIVPEPIAVARLELVARDVRAGGFGRP
jgi:hypothetical protein